MARDEKGSLRGGSRPPCRRVRERRPRLRGRAQTVWPPRWPPRPAAQGQRRAERPRDASIGPCLRPGCGTNKCKALVGGRHCPRNVPVSARTGSVADTGLSGEQSFKENQIFRRTIRGKLPASSNRERLRSIEATDGPRIPSAVCGGT